jgi:hypothetical protein
VATGTQLDGLEECLRRLKRIINIYN